MAKSIKQSAMPTDPCAASRLGTVAASAVCGQPSKKYDAIRHADRSLRRFAAWDCRGIRRMRPTMCTSARERALCVCTHGCPRMADC